MGAARIVARKPSRPAGVAGIRFDVREVHGAAPGD
jgi:hypothetical protein